jgi:RNA polymerase sigma-70 factor, ECF subfamily
MLDSPEPRWKALMVRAQAGEAAAQGQLLRDLAPRLRAFFLARGCGAADAEDLVQETLVSIHTKRALYDAGQPFTAWAYAIARYRLIDVWRRNGRRGVHVPVEDWSEALASDAPEPGDAARDVATLLAHLPEKQRRVIELTRLKEHTVREAAQLTGWSESDVKISVHRGMKALTRLVGLGAGRPGA